METKERLFSDAFGTFKDRYSDPGEGVKYIAHWIWWEGKHFKSIPIGNETEGFGLQKKASIHPDQVFWQQKGLKKRPTTDAAIVTDCKLLPCAKDIYSCAYRVPRLIEEMFGKGIPMATFCHNDNYFLSHGKMGYYTLSGATKTEVDEAMALIFMWDWDEIGDTSTY